MKIEDYDDYYLVNLENTADVKYFSNVFYDSDAKKNFKNIYHYRNYLWNDGPPIISVNKNDEKNLHEIKVLYRKLKLERILNE